MPDQPCDDAVVEKNVGEIRDRSRVGAPKYGRLLHASPESLGAFCQHGIEEALDLANYLQTVRMRVDAANLPAMHRAVEHACSCIQQGDPAGALDALDLVRTGLRLLTGERALVEVL